MVHELMNPIHIMQAFFAGTLYSISIVLYLYNRLSRLEDNIFFLRTCATSPDIEVLTASFSEFKIGVTSTTVVLRMVLYFIMLLMHFQIIQYIFFFIKDSTTSISLISILATQFFNYNCFQHICHREFANLQSS